MRAQEVRSKFLNDFFLDLKQFAFKDKYRKKRPATYHKLMDSTRQVAFVCRAASLK
jgi:hypothetical protein